MDYKEIEQLDDLAFEKALDERLEAAMIKVTDTYETPPQIIWVNDSTIATLGNFSASTGKAKAKKTFNVSALVAASLANTQILNYRAQLPEGKQRILYVDTEQSRFHCHNVLERILKLAKLPTTVDNDKLDFLGLREDKPWLRIKLIDRQLRKHKDYGLVIIDGIRDLLLDINNATESVEVINKMMEWSSRYNLHIHCVLHQNKGDNNVRGHIGTEMNNKAETVLVIAKDQVQPDNSIVKAMHIREKDFSPFAFTVDEEGLPVLVDNFNATEERVAKKSVRYYDLTLEQHHEALSVAFSETDAITGYEPMVAALMEAYKVVDFKRGKNITGQLLKYLTDDIKLVKHIDRSYYYGSTGEQQLLFGEDNDDEQSL